VPYVLSFDYAETIQYDSEGNIGDYGWEHCGLGSWTDPFTGEVNYTNLTVTPTYPAFPVKFLFLTNTTDYHNEAILIPVHNYDGYWVRVSIADAADPSTILDSDIYFVNGKHPGNRSSGKVGGFLGRATNLSQRRLVVRDIGVNPPDLLTDTTLAGTTETVLFVVPENAMLEATLTDTTSG